jgi:hypothetical protein
MCTTETRWAPHGKQTPTTYTAQHERLLSPDGRGNLADDAYFFVIQVPVIWRAMGTKTTTRRVDGKKLKAGLYKEGCYGIKTSGIVLQRGRGKE